MFDHIKNHRFANVLDAMSEAIEPWDQTIAESNSFVAIPTKGSIVPGWVLILPRRHVISMRTLTERERCEYQEFSRIIIQRISHEFSAPTVFEHGAGYPGSNMGCGVDHAHMHFVPLEFDLVDMVRRNESFGINWKAFETIQQFYSSVPPDRDYMTIAAPDGRLIGASGFVPVSQYLRRVIALNVGDSSQWDYRLNSFEGNVLETLSRLKVSGPNQIN